MTVGSGLKLSPGGGDVAKVVYYTGACSDAAQGGSLEVADLGPDDADGATNATATFTFSKAGVYKVCYKVLRGNFVEVGSSNFTVFGVAPTLWSINSTVYTAKQFTLSFDGGSGLKLDGSGDSAKIVSNESSCSNSSAGGTTVVTELGPDDMDGASAAMANFTFQTGGYYLVCYKVLGGSWAQVSDEIITVVGVAPTTYTYTAGVFTATSVALTMSGGSGMKLMPTGGDSARVIDSTQSCLDSGAFAGGTQTVTDLGPADTDGTTVALANFTFVTAGYYIVCYKVPVPHKLLFWCSPVPTRQHRSCRNERFPAAGVVGTPVAADQRHNSHCAWGGPHSLH